MHGEPTHEYLNNEKAQYRESVWAAFAEAVPDPSTANVLFFPGRHGLEIPVALRYGFSEENLIACDENAAILATAKWRKEYPAMRCYGTKLKRTIERLAADGIVLDAIALDYCSNLCTAVISDLRQILLTQGDTLIIAITLLKGREDRALADIARLAFHQPHGPMDRMAIIQALFASWDFRSRSLLNSEYRSGSKNMTYGVFTVKAISAIKREHMDCLEAYAAEIDALLDLDEVVIYAETAAEHRALKHEFWGRREVISDAWDAISHHYSGWNGPPWIIGKWEGSVVSKYFKLISIGDRQYKGPPGGVRLDEIKRLRRRLVASETERAQLLQAGRAYN